MILKYLFFLLKAPLQETKKREKNSTVQYATNVSTRNGVYTLWLIIFGLGIKGMVWLWMSSVADD